MSSTTADAPRAERGWPRYRTLWLALMLGWTVSAADRTITGLAFGITIATLMAPPLINWGGHVFGATQAWRMAFVALGVVTLIVATGITLYFRRAEPRLPYF